jgi:hypothetical protein
MVLPIHFERNSTDGIDKVSVVIRDWTRALNIPFCMGSLSLWG